MTKTVPQYPFPATSPEKAVEALHRILEDRPMTKVTMPFGGEAWVIHRHQAARQMLESTKFGRGPFARGEQEIPYFVQFPDFLKTTLQFADSPDHTRLRKLVAKAFTARRVSILREGTQAIADELLDAMAGRRSAGQSRQGLLATAFDPGDQRVARRAAGGPGQVHRMEQVDACDVRDDR